MCHAARSRVVRERATVDCAPRDRISHSILSDQWRRMVMRVVRGYMGPSSRANCECHRSASVEEKKRANPPMPSHRPFPR